MPLSSNISVVILAAGEGTRMKSSFPKVIHQVAGFPMVHYPVELARRVTLLPPVVVMGNGVEVVGASLDAAFGPMGYRGVFQTERKGTAHAVLAARAALEEQLASLGADAGDKWQVLILYGDVPNLTELSLSRLLEQVEAKSAAVGVLTFIADNPTGYGRIIRDPVSERVLQIVEEKDCSAGQAAVREVNSGTLCVNGNLLFSLLDLIGNHNAKGEYYLTDVVRLAVEQGRTVVGVVAEEPGEVLGVNDRVDLAQANRIRRERINSKHMRNGVTMEDPWSAIIDEGVEFGQDCVVGPSVRIGRGSRIGRGVTIGMGCFLGEGVVVEDGVALEPYCVIAGSSISIGAGARVGPFSRLREGTRLGEKAHVGNFVETKKAVLGVGSKANHLSYIGDAVVGQRVNIGAGTITCNYDGFAKHRTELGDGVFIGSDTQLVAPVKVGANAYVAAGTTVTTDVPDGCLAISRAPQVNKEGYADKVAARRKAMEEEKVRAEQVGKESGQGQENGRVQDAGNGLPAVESLNTAEIAQHGQDDDGSSQG